MDVPGFRPSDSHYTLAFVLKVTNHCLGLWARDYEDTMNWPAVDGRLFWGQTR